MAEVDSAFYDRADAHIHLSNDQITETAMRGKVSASMMYANARFSAWLAATWSESQSEMDEKRDEHITYFVDQFRSMLEENYADYRDNYETYMCK